MVNCDPFTGSDNPYEDAWQDQYCSFGDTWGQYIWMALAVAAILVIVWAVKRRSPSSPEPAPAPIAPASGQQPATASPDQDLTPEEKANWENHGILPGR